MRELLRARLLVKSTWNVSTSSTRLAGLLKPGQGLMLKAKDMAMVLRLRPKFWPRDHSGLVYKMIGVYVVVVCLLAV